MATIPEQVHKKLSEHLQQHPFPIEVSLAQVHNEKHKLNLRHLFELHKLLFDKSQVLAEKERDSIRAKICTKLLEVLSSNPEIIERIPQYKIRDILHQGNSYDCLYHSLVNALDLLEPDIGRRMTDAEHIAIKESLIRKAKAKYKTLSESKEQKSKTNEENALEFAKQFVKEYLPNRELVTVESFSFIEEILLGNAVGILNIKEPDDTKYTNHSVLIYPEAVNGKIKLMAVDSLVNPDKNKKMGPYAIPYSVLLKSGNAYHLIKVKKN